MEKFDWRQAETTPVQYRYSEDVIGYRAWRKFVIRILETSVMDASVDVWSSPFGDFLSEIEEERPKGEPACCLFISHRQNDVDSALHIAWIATHAGYDYWLDIHDPNLLALNGSQLASPARDVMVAAIVEIALLNATHVIALHTNNSAGSQWIPYELGRAKARLVHSDQAAGWFARNIHISSCGEYVHLVKQIRTGAEIQRWLSNTHTDRCQVSPKKWTHEDPPPPLNVPEKVAP